MSRSHGDSVLSRREFWRHAGVLVSGNAASAFVAVGVVSITARHLGPTDFGQLAIIAAIYQLVSRLAVVQTGPAAIKFGVEALSDERKVDLAGLLGWCLRVEWGSALAAATVCGLGLAIGAFYASESIASLLVAGAAFLAPLAINVSSYASGVLRLSNSFRAVALQGFIANSVKLLGCSYVYLALSEATLVIYAAVWSAGDVVGQLFLGLASRKASRSLVSPARRPKTAPTLQWPYLTRFVATGVGHNAVKSVIREGDVLLVGALAGPVSAGSFRLVKQVGSALGRLVDPLQQAIFPLLAQRAAAHDLDGMRVALVRLAVVTLAGFSVLFLAFLLAGKQALTWLFGAGFDGIFEAATVYLIGTVIAMISLGLHPAALALGVPMESLRVLAVSSVFYLALLVVLVPQFGPSGAAAAYVGFYSLWSIQLWVRVRRRLAGHNV